MAVPENNLKLNMPKTGAQNDLEEKEYDRVASRLTLILLKDGNSFVYEGLDVNKGSTVSKTNLRKVTLAAKQHFPSDKFIVLIKPTAESNYGSTVDVLDERSSIKLTVMPS
jgi:hypothetical protein